MNMLFDFMRGVFIGSIVLILMSWFGFDPIATSFWIWYLIIVIPLCVIDVYVWEKFDD